MAKPTMSPLRIAIAGALLFASLVASTDASADERFDALVRSLERHVDYRARAAAALVLGESRDEKAAPPLCAGLADKHVIVRMSSAAALGRLGRGDAIQCLVAAFAKEADAGVKQQIERSLGALRGPGGSTATAHTPSKPGLGTKYYVVLHVKNDSGRPSAEVDAVVREAVQMKLRATPGYIIAPKDASDADVAATLSTLPVRGFALEVAVPRAVSLSDGLAQALLVDVVSLPLKTAAAKLTERANKVGAEGNDREADQLLRKCAASAVLDFEKYAEGLQTSAAHGGDR